MSYLKRTTLVLFSALMLNGASISAEEIPIDRHELKMSPELIEILRAEMRELLTGVQSLPAAIAIANWQSVANTSSQIRASYILDKELTAAQRKELNIALPEHFKRLDADFHLEAKKLELAAEAHDAQLSTFHFYRLLEACTACHAMYASSKFPGFLPPVNATHDH